MLREDRVKHEKYWKILLVKNDNVYNLLYIVCLILCLMFFLLKDLFLIFLFFYVLYLRPRG